MIFHLTTFNQTPVKPGYSLFVIIIISLSHNVLLFAGGLKDDPVVVSTRFQKSNVAIYSSPLFMRARLFIISIAGNIAELIQVFENEPPPPPIPHPTPPLHPPPWL